MTTTALVLANSTQITTVKGNVIGQRVTCNEKGTPSQIKGTLKATGLKGKALTLAVNDVVYGGRDVAWVKFDAAASAMRSAGYVPTVIEARAKTGVARFAKAEALKTEADKKAEAMALLGLTQADLDEVKKSDASKATVNV